MFDSILQNTSKPKGLGGKIILKMMNVGHSKLSDWGFSHLSLKSTDHVLDVGCGGGANIAKLLKQCSNGFVAGIDYSEESVKYSKKRNSKNIGKNCEIIVADVSNIPFEDEKFDVVTAFETIYFWTDLSESFKEIRRVLKSGGIFMICCEDGQPKDEKWSKVIKGMKVYGISQLITLLKYAGFSIIKTDEKENSICIIGKKQ